MEEEWHVFMTRLILFQYYTHPPIIYGSRIVRWIFRLRLCQSLFSIASSSSILRLYLQRFAMPILLSANQPPDRFYCGGPEINRFRYPQSTASDRNDLQPTFQPEDWVASTTPCHGCRPLGLTKLPDGRLLADAIVTEPEYWLGPAHVAAFGADTKLLVKLLDAGQRLPVHAHPDGYWARKHVPGATHGKAEAWYVLKGGEVHLGLREDVALDELRQLVLSQEVVPNLLERLHRLDVRPHQTVYIPPGFLHAIGKGMLVVEVQEPSDLSVLLEWRGFAIDGAQKGHLGVGWDTALTSVDRVGRRREDIEKLVMDGSRSTTSTKQSEGVFATPSEEFFRLERVKMTGGRKHALTQGFAVVIVLGGAFTLGSMSSSDKLHLPKGSTALLAFADGTLTLQGTGEALVARPPKA